MDLTLTQEQMAIKDRAAEFAKAEAHPLWNRFEEDGRAVINLAKMAKSAGLLDGLRDNAAGSSDLITFAMLIEELALGEAGLALIIANEYLCRRAIQLLGNASTQTAALERLNNIDDFFGTVLLWPNVGEFERERAATIKHGRLRAVSYNSMVSDETSSFIGIATLEGDKGERKEAFYFVNGNDRLFQFEPRSSLGLRASPIGKSILEKQLGDADLIIEFENEDLLADFWRDMMAERKLLYAATLIGIARASLGYALDYAKERTAFGKPISQHQAVGLKLADMAIVSEAARLMIWRAAEPEAGHLARDLVEAAWLYAKEVSIEVAIEGVQILGGHGYLKLHPLEKWLRDVQTLRILF